MSMEMQIFYHTINTVVTNFYYICLILLLSNIVDHKKYIVRTVLIYIGLNAISTIMTQTAVPALIKVYVQCIYITIMYRFFLSEKMAAVSMHSVYFWFICSTVQEHVIIFFCKINHINPWVDVGHGVQLGKARVILVSSLLMLALTLLLKHILKPFSEVMENRDIWLLVVSGLIFQGLSDTLRELFYRHVEGPYLMLGIVLIVGVAFIALLLSIIFYRFLYVEKREREERIQVEVLRKQFDYYREKQKDEERVRSVYHDMKNHLLVLEHKIHSPEAAEMVEELQQELESYAGYVHTGNDFLDVIINDKARVAREKQIDFSVDIDLHGMDMLEPLDISTIFGNGLDNAIEASEKLPRGQKVILVKAGRVQDFLSISMENNCQAGTQGEDGAQRKKHTGRRDGYFHGFGISNMKKAAEKYGGQLTVKREEGRFTLKILIPISVA